MENRVLNKKQQQLIVENFDLVDIMTDKCRHMLPERSDIVSTMNEALCMAALNYDETREVAEFRTYAGTYMEGFLKNYIRDTTPHYYGTDGNPVFVSEISIDYMRCGKDDLNDEDMGLEAVIPAEPVNDTERRETMECRFKSLMKGLTKKERKLILSKYGFDGQMSISEHARRQGVSETAIYLQIYKIENKLAHKAALIKKVS